jgi:transcriptional regulator with XRE-family HTH domain
MVGKEPGHVDAELRFGQRLRECRQRLHLTQQHVARVLNETHGLRWHQTTVAKTESAERPVMLAEAAALAAVLGVPLAEFLDDPPDGAARTELAARYAAQETGALIEIGRMLGYLALRERELLASRFGVDPQAP